MTAPEMLQPAQILAIHLEHPPKIRPTVLSTVKITWNTNLPEQSASTLIITIAV